MPTYVVYNIKTTRLFHSKGHMTHFSSLSAAKRSLTVAARSGRLLGYINEYTIDTLENFLRA